MYLGMFLILSICAYCQPYLTIASTFFMGINKISTVIFTPNSKTANYFTDKIEKWTSYLRPIYSICRHFSFVCFFFLGYLMAITAFSYGIIPATTLMTLNMINLIFGTNISFYAGTPNYLESILEDSLCLLFISNTFLFLYYICIMPTCYFLNTLNIELIILTGISGVIAINITALLAAFDANVLNHKFTKAIPFSRMNTAEFMQNAMNSLFKIQNLPEGEWNENDQEQLNTFSKQYPKAAVQLLLRDTQYKLPNDNNSQGDRIIQFPDNYLSTTALR